MLWARLNVLCGQSGCEVGDFTCTESVLVNMLVNNKNDWKMYFGNSHMKCEKYLLPPPALKFFFMEVSSGTHSRKLDAW